MSKQDAKGPKAKSASAKGKAATEAFDPSSLGLRPPARLPIIDGFDPELDAAIVALDGPRSDAWSAGYQRVCTNGTPADLPHVLARLSPEAFDLGAMPKLPHPPVPDSESPVDALSPKDRRTYQRAFDVIYGAKEGRKSYLETLVPLALRVEHGDAVVAERIEAADDPEVAGFLARRLVIARQPKCLAALARFYDREGWPGDVQDAWVGAAAARLLFDPAGFLEETEALWSVEVTDHTSAQRMRIHTILLAMSWLEKDAPVSWRGRAEAMLTGDDDWLDSSALGARKAAGMDPAFENVLAGYIERRMAAKGWTSGIIDLGPIATTRSTHILARALDHGAYDDAIFDALSRLRDARAAGAVRRFVEKHKQRDPATWPSLARAIATLALLEAIELRSVAEEFPPPLPSAPAPLPPKRKAAPKPKWPKAEGAQEQRAELVELLSKAGLGRHAEALIRPGMQLLTKRAKPNELPLGATRLGGSPDLPKGTSWPMFEGRPLWFVAQLRLEDFAPHDPEKRLPGAGLLSFFVEDLDPDAYLEHCAVVHSSSLEGLVRLAAPKELLAPKGSPPRLLDAACAVEVRPLLMLPLASDARVRRLLSKPEREAYAGLPSWDGFHRVLGVRGGVVEPGDGERELLFQCTSDEQADMQWGDLHHVCFMLDEQALRKGDFSGVTSEYVE